MEYHTLLSIDKSLCGIWEFEYYRDYQLHIKTKAKQIEIKLYDQTWNEDCFVELILLESNRIDFWAHCSYGILEFSVFLNNNKEELIVICSDQDYYHRVTEDESLFIFPVFTKIKPFKDTWYEKLQSNDRKFPLWCAGEWCPQDGVGHLSIIRLDSHTIKLAVRSDIDSRSRVWINAIGKVNALNINFTAYSKIKNSLASKTRPIKYKITFSQSSKKILVEEFCTRIAMRK